MYQVNKDDMSIYVTRGDIFHLSVTAEDNGEPYIFKSGDLLRIKVFAKKDCESVVMQKDFPIPTDTDTVEIFLDENDTKIGEVISKPRDYWYEVELNPLTNPQTIIGYDEDGTKVFRLFPEGRDLTENDPVITPEDIPVVDTGLSLYSKRPVENQVVTRALYRLEGAIKGCPAYAFPEMYGAIGDGVTDDTNAICAMLNDERFNVFRCRGTYKISVNSLSITRDNLTIRGGTFKVNATDEISSLFNIYGANGVRFDSVNFSATLVGNTRANVIALHMKGVSNVLIENCNFENFDYNVKIDRYNTVTNNNIRIEGCDMENSLMPVYVEYTEGFYVSKCRMNISDQATTYEHHIYGSSECNNHYIRECVFEGGIGNSVHYYSAYAGEGVNGRIYVENCSFFNVPCAVNMGNANTKLFCTNINVVTEQTGNTSIIFKAIGGELHINGFNVNAPNAKLFQLAASSYGLIANGTAVVSAGSYNIEDGATAIVRNCDITITTNSNVIYSNNSPNVVVENCNLTKSHDSTLGKSTVFSVRGSSASLKAIGNVIHGNDLIHQFVYNGSSSNENMFFLNNVAFGISYEKADGILGTFVNNTVIN